MLWISAGQWAFWVRHLGLGSSGVLCQAMVERMVRILALSWQNPQRVDPGVLSDRCSALRPGAACCCSDTWI